MPHGLHQALIPISQSLSHFLEHSIFHLIGDVKTAVLNVKVHLVHEVFLADGQFSGFIRCDHFKDLVNFAHS
jgi:hypothetical protein